MRFLQLHPWTLASVALFLATTTPGCDSHGTSSAPLITQSIAPASSRMKLLRDRYGAWVGRSTATWRESPDGLEATLGPEDGAAAVRLPRAASGGVRIVDKATGVALEASLEGATDAPLSLEDGAALYRAGYGEADVLRLAGTASAEDLVAFEQRPEKEELVYRLRLEHASGLHLARGRLEIIDDHGAPRLGIPAPFSVDASGARREARMEVRGCAVDENPAPTWGRELRKLDAKECALVIDFRGASYPLLVDPQWTDSGNMIDKRTHHSATLLPNDTVLLAGGFDENGSPLASAEIMCPREVCTTGTTFTPAAGLLATARGGQTETQISPTQILFTGGKASRSAAGGLASAELCTFSPSFSCTSLAMSTARANHTATLLANGTVLVAGGGTANPSTAEIYNPASGFAAPTTMTARRTGHAAELLSGNGKVLIAGGIGSLGIAVQTAELFDPGSNSFAPTGNLTSQRAFATATRLEDAVGSVLVAGGTNGGGFFYKTADIFVPSGTGGSFQQQPVLMKVSRAYHRASKLLGTGTVLFTGGFDGTSVTPDTEAFDQATTMFSLQSTMNHARAFHAAAVLKSGQAIVTGGGFNPATGSVDTSAASSSETLQRSNGDACTANGECALNNCIKQGNAQLCCDLPCADPCSACVKDAAQPKDGVCHQLPDNTPLPTLADCQQSVAVQFKCESDKIKTGKIQPCSPYTCNGTLCGSGTCTTDSQCSPDAWCRVGDSCQPKQDSGVCATNQQCKSGHCVDGVCCDTACTEQCAACDSPASIGKCTQVAGPVRSLTLAGSKPTGRANCLGFGAECAGQCGSNPTSCDFHDSPCGTPSCTNDIAESGKCSLSSPGTCQMTSTDCGSYGCDNDTKACKNQCSKSSDCAPGHICKVDGTCVAVVSVTCDGDHTLAKPDGTNEDCSPFRCNGAACLNRCNSVDDCVSPNVCDDKGKCVAPPAAPGAPKGCAVAALGGASNLQSEWLATLALGLAAARRRRSARRGGAE